MRVTKTRNMYRIKKTFGSYPFGHRQHNHEGHCAKVHGHNWTFTIELESSILDENGFVYDFGKFKELKEWLTYMFDHTLLINERDPEKEHFTNSETCKLWDVRVVPNGSAETLAEFIANHIEINVLKGHNARLVSVTAKEDEKNEAIFIC